ncbi:MAG: pepN [Cytophagaceae bacterium]|jgi:aminopeptidase N|nr:pepN [Cytophagaceae bacterium]
MNSIVRSTLVLALLSTFIGCQSQQGSKTSSKTKDSNTPVVTLENEKVLTEKDTLPYQASYTRLHDLLHTKLTVAFDWQKQQMNGTANLVLKPYFYDQKEIILDAKGFDIHEVSLVKPNAKTLVYSYDKKKLIVTLDKTYTQKDTFELKIKYTAKPNELPKGGSAAITEDKGLYFINADGKDPKKPKQIWTQGETEAASCWFPTIDAPNERCTQEMFITVEDKYTVISNGELIYSKKNADGTKTVNWKMNKPHAPYLFMMVVGEFAEVKDTWRGKEVHYFVEKEYEPYAKAIFGNTPEMLEFFSTRLNYDYAWNKYYQVVVRDYVSGAMENTTASIFMEALQVDDRALLDDNWETIVAHELFHHWFGDLVTCESWSNLPLNESFANYSEYLWLEHKFGKDEADYHSIDEQDGYLGEAQSKQVDLIRFHYKEREDMFDAHSYNKGGRVLHMLRNYVGDEAFFKSLSLYLKKNEFTSVEIHNLRLAFEEVTGEDLNWFFNQWFLNKGHADIKISHRYEGGNLVIKVKQDQDPATTPIYKLPIDIDIYDAADNKVRKRIWITKDNEEVKIPLAAKPKLVIEDPEYQILGTVEHSKPTEEWYAQFALAKNYMARLDAVDHIFEVGEDVNPFENNPKNRELLHSILKDSFWDVRFAGLAMFSKFFIERPEEYAADMENIAMNDPKSLVRARCIFLLNSLDKEKFKTVFQKNIDAKPYSVAGASLFALLSLKDSTAIARLPEFEKYNNINIVIPLAVYFTESVQVDKYQWFKNAITTASDRGVYQLLNYFGTYLTLVTAEEKKDGMAVLKEISEKNKHEVIREAAKAQLASLK